MKVERKRRRARRRRETVRRGLGLFLTRVLPLAALLVVVLQGWPHAKRWLVGTEWLQVERVRVSGNRVLTPRDVLDIAGVTPGMSLLDVRANGATERLLLHPRVKAATISYVFPRDLRVRVDERTAIALLDRGELLPLSTDGVLLHPVPGRVSEPLPVILPPREMGIDGHLVQDAGVLEGLDFLTELAAADSRLSNSVSLIDLTDARFARVHLDTMSVALIYELGGGWNAHVAALPSVVGDLLREQWHGAVLDLRFREQIIRRGGTLAQLTPS